MNNIKDYNSKPAIASCKSWIVTGAALCITVVFCYLSLSFLSFPFFWALLFCSFFFFYPLLVNRKGKRKVISFNLAVIFLLLSAFELVFSLMEKHEEKRSPVKTDRVYETENDDYLGTRLRKNTTRHAKKYYNGQLLYDVIITVDSNGQRISPACKGNCDTAVLFFGDSYTYGEGVNDTESFPYQAGLALRQKYRIFNFGMHGYGPHQMLSAIEHGIVDSAVRQKVPFVIYQCIYPEHIKRMKGIRFWDIHGPKYKVGKDGQVYYSGHFDDNRLARYLYYKSAFYRKIVTFDLPLTSRDKKLFTSVMIRSKQLLTEKYPGSEFHMILWDWSEGKDKAVFDELENKGIYIHNIEDILPGHSKLNMKFKLSKFDKHPNPLAYRIIAEYVVKNIIKKSNSKK